MSLIATSDLRKKNFKPYAAVLGSSRWDDRTHTQPTDLVAVFGILH